MTSDDMEKYRILHSQKADETANKVLWQVFDPSPDHQIVREWITSYGMPDGSMAGLLKILRDAETKKTPPREIPVDDDGLAFLDRLMISKRQAWANMDDLSEGGSKTAPTGHGGGSLSFRTVAGRPGEMFLDALETTKESGGYLGIHGGPRMGKTGMALSIGRFAVNAYPGTEFVTNAPVPDGRAKGIVYVETIMDLFRRIADAREVGRRWWWGLEEASLGGLVRSRGSSGFVIDFQRFVRIVPKLGGSLIVDEHREEDVPSVLAAFIQSRVTCVRPGFILVNLPGYRGAIHGVPKPDVEYESGQPAPFQIPEEWDWDGLFHALRYDPSSLRLEEDSGPILARRIRAFLDEMEAEPAPKRPLVTCRFCGYAWEPRSAVPDQCPSCRRAHPLAEAIPEPAPVM